MRHITASLSPSSLFRARAAWHIRTRQRTSLAVPLRAMEMVLGTS